jgi:signal peptidase
MRQGGRKKSKKQIRMRVIAVLRRILLITLALLLGVKLYAWNAGNFVGNRLPMPFGYGVSIVLSGSMEPVLSVNDLVILKETNDPKIGDVIVYERGNELIIHRVLAVDGDTITTKGEANNIADEPFDVSLVRGKMIAVIPAIGGLVRILKTPAGIVILLATVLILMELPYRRNRKEDDRTEEIKAEIRRLKEENGDVKEI